MDEAKRTTNDRRHIALGYATVKAARRDEKTAA
jgi:hypothetical protein